ncbi:MAG: hypothetical protein WKF94_06310 [Solirubrobacteraceae bacterium]
MLGSSNTKASGDWVQRLNPMVEKLTGAPAVTVVGTLGRTQPADRGCADEALEDDAESLCALDTYAGRIAERVIAALAAARPIGGDPAVAARSYLVQDAGTNPFLLGLLYAGDALAAPLNRALTPPWQTGNVIGTVTGTARIGDVLVSAVPGEIYPQIAEAVRDSVGKRVRGFMTLGLANDQLGYIIAPFPGAYEKPICATAFEDCGDTLPAEPGALPNDNYFFNASNTLGERVICSCSAGRRRPSGSRACAMRGRSATCTAMTPRSRRAPTWAATARGRHSPAGRRSRCAPPPVGRSPGGGSSAASFSTGACRRGCVCSSCGAGAGSQDGRRPAHPHRPARQARQPPAPAGGRRSPDRARATSLNPEPSGYYPF